MSRTSPPKVSPHHHQAATWIYQRQQFCCARDLVDGLGLPLATAKTAFKRLRELAAEFCGHEGYIERKNGGRIELLLLTAPQLPAFLSQTDRVSQALRDEPDLLKLSLRELCRRFGVGKTVASVARGRVTGQESPKEAARAALRASGRKHRQNGSIDDADRVGYDRHRRFTQLWHAGRGA